MKVRKWRCTIATLPKEEEVPIVSTMDDKLLDGHVKEESLHEEHELIENHMDEVENQPLHESILED